MSASPRADEEPLGSLTTQQQQRTSARVIKKLRLDDAADKEKKDPTECDQSLLKAKEDDSKLQVKPRMPKAIWLTEEKNLFFEALNEYGKDFDAITAHICGKMKKKGVPDAMIKTKNQVSHFYYRTWHKLSKHVQFDENVKKVAQELYALINYGELRRKLLSVSEKTCARLAALVATGALLVRSRGRNVRVRTPACRALRRLNQITDRSATRVPPTSLSLRPRGAAAAARARAAARCPRLLLAAAPAEPLRAVILALEARWSGETPDDYRLRHAADGAADEDRLDFEPERMLVLEEARRPRARLHVGPPRALAVHGAALSAPALPSARTVCLNSYLARLGRGDADCSKIRTPKRQRKDSATDKDRDRDRETENKRQKTDESEPKLLNIDETAIDGIELMASIKQVNEIKDLTEFDEEAREKEMKNDLAWERDKDSFSELEDDDKFKSDSDNDSDGGKKEKEGDGKYKNLKVKFRIRTKKRGGSVYQLVTGDASPTKDPGEEPKTDDVKPEPEPESGKPEPESGKPDEKEDDKPDIDVEFVTRQIRKGWSALDAGQLTVGDLYLMFGSRSKVELEYWWAEPTPPLAPHPRQTETERSPVERASETKDRKEKSDKTPEKGTDSSLEDGEKRESDTDMFSPKNTFSQDSNDGMSGDERKGEQTQSPDYKCVPATFQLARKLVNRPDAPDDARQRLAVISDRLKRLLSLAGNPHCAPPACGCGHACAAAKKKPAEKPPPAPSLPAVFRHPTPIAPKPDTQTPQPLSTLDLGPRHRRGRPRNDRTVVVQRLLPLLPKLPARDDNIRPVKLVSSAPVPPRLLPRPAPAPPNDVERVFVLSQRGGQLYFHDGDARVPLAPAAHADHANHANHADHANHVDHANHADHAEHAGPNGAGDPEDPAEVKHQPVKCESDAAATEGKITGDMASFLPADSLSLSPSRLQAGWLDGAVDFSLSSFLGQLGAPPDMQMDSQLHSLLAESSVDYVAKFADLAAEVARSGPDAPPE